MENEDLIQILLKDDLFEIIDNRNYDYLEDILRCGFVGYDKQSDTDLLQECLERELLGDEK